MKTRKVGTLTLGISLVLFGILFLVHLFFNALSYSLIFRLWPIVLLLMGGEILLGTNEKAGFAFEKGSIALLFLMALFSIGMAAADVVMQYMLTYCAM